MANLKTEVEELRPGGIPQFNPCQQDRHLVTHVTFSDINPREVSMLSIIRHQSAVTNSKQLCDKLSMLLVLRATNHLRLLVCIVFDWLPSDHHHHHHHQHHVYASSITNVLWAHVYIQRCVSSNIYMFAL